MDRTLWNRGKGLTRHDVELCRLDVEKAVISPTLAVYLRCTAQKPDVTRRSRFAVSNNRQEHGWV